jgi:3-hydroxyacyl-CoA dehydrogenase
MNPVPVMKLVEIIPGLATNDPTLKTTLALARAMGKTTAQVRDRDRDDKGQRQRTEDRRRLDT